MGNDDFLSDDKQHELLGADYLEKRFPEEVMGAIRLHVPAKRYLCQAVAGYWDALSAASKRSLEAHRGGGPRFHRAALRRGGGASSAVGRFGQASGRGDADT